ncbi:MAG: archaemetzincin family Zn-dependent metalloprotease [Candidatus Bathyarchaeia archaeon]|nr:archaemetzincin family Zn-dependent metalloprotease [Candidatus Bathyarchaeota archaeon]
MIVCIVGFEGVERNLLNSIREGVEEVLGEGTCTILDEVLKLPSEAYNHLRGQYMSEQLLKEVSKLAMGGKYKDSILLGVADVDIYAHGMNFIFGLAQCPGRAALISLFRLRPEFYGENPNKSLFLERAIKEALHEIGHTLGLKHCRDPLCVMYFSLHIGMTDRKSKFFCRYCLKNLRHIFQR